MSKRVADLPVMKLGVASRQHFMAQSLAIARGEYKPAPGEPKAWFCSLHSISQILSEDNLVLLRTIYETRPNSLKELAQNTGRSCPSLSRTLKKMADHGIVTLLRESRELRPIVNATKFTIEFSLLEA